MKEPMNHLEHSPEVHAIFGYLAQSAGPKLKGTPLTLDTDLLASGVLDSLGILQLTTFLSGELSVEVADEDFLPENFQTVGSLARFVRSKRLAA
jgi:acyl carrier protein